MESNLFVAILVAATLPLVASILSAFSSRTKVRDESGYFLYDRALDIDSFLKTTVGYSLQVASITLFFYWSFTYGFLGSVVVCVAWSSGYYLLANRIDNCSLDNFLGTASTGTKTIHGFIGGRMGNAAPRWRTAGVLAVSLASVIGLGGTMMAEIDYGTQFFIGTLQVGPHAHLLQYVIEGSILTFTGLYVLWGGYKSAVYTDRFQVPAAYLAFSMFGFGVTVISGGKAAENGAGYIIATMSILFIIILRRRYKLLRSTDPGDTWNELTAYLTFVPIILAGLASLFFLWHASSPWSLAPLSPILFPNWQSLIAPHTFLGFGMWGTLALILANGIWQFIDISSLQRLQSLDLNEVRSKREHVVTALRITGFEAGAGWLLIALTAALLKSAGFSFDAGGFSNIAFGNLLHTAQGGTIARLAPIFIFTTVVYMLSTISGFISSISYISFYDIVLTIAGGPDKGRDLRSTLHWARATTVVVIAAIFLMYVVLRVLMTMSGNGDAIASVLYAIYAFQISIAPSAMIALFMPKIRVSAPATVASVSVGIVVSYWSAINGQGWSYLEFIGADSSSWAVIPPLASAIASTVVYVIVGVFISPPSELSPEKVL